MHWSHLVVSWTQTVSLCCTMIIFFLFKNSWHFIGKWLRTGNLPIISQSYQSLWCHQVKENALLYMYVHICRYVCKYSEVNANSSRRRFKIDLYGYVIYIKYQHYVSRSSRKYLMTPKLRQSAIWMMLSGVLSSQLTETCHFFILNFVLFKKISTLTFDILLIISAHIISII